MRRLLALFLSLLLALCALPSAALAAGGERDGATRFADVRTWVSGTFTDIAAGDPFFEDVRATYQKGLMEGIPNSLFDPEGDLTIGETVALAARLRSIYDAADYDFAVSQPWYQSYVTYAKGVGIIGDEYDGLYDTPVTRREYATIFAAALPEEAYPDVRQDASADGQGGEAVDLLRRAGVISGAPFAPDGTIKRGEIAGVVNRIADRSLRDGGGSDAVYTVTFETDGGTAVSGQRVRNGQCAAGPADPVKANYLFMGWLDPSGDYFDFSHPIEQNLTLTADWVKLASFNELSEGTQMDLGTLEITGQTTQELQGSALTGVTVGYVLDDVGAVSVTTIADDPMSNAPGLMGAPVELLALGGDVQSAKITFTYDPAALDGVEPQDLAVVWFDEQNGTMVLLEDTAVDTSARTVSVETGHFSKYAVVDKTEWDRAQNTQLAAVRTEQIPYYNVVLAIDCSGSMSGERTAKSVEAAQGLVDALADDDCVSVLAFEDSAREVLGTTRLVETKDDGTTVDNRGLVKEKIAAMYANGGTNIDSALTMGATYAGDAQHQSLLVLLTDGEGSVRDSSLAKLKEQNQKVIAVGVGNAGAAELMKRIADATGGSYIYCENASDLQDAFIDLQNTYIGSTTDSDGDGLPDLVETTGMRDQYGKIWRTDPNRADTDGDGIGDAEEMGQYVALADHPYFKRVSAPDITTVTENGTWLKMDGKGMYSLQNSEPNTIKLVATVYENPYTRVTSTTLGDASTPASGGVKEVFYQPAQNLKVELVDIPGGFTLESLDVKSESVETQGAGACNGKVHTATAILSYQSDVTWETVKWRVSADNFGKPGDYQATAGIHAEYVEQTQDTKPQKVDQTYRAPDGTSPRDVEKARTELAERAKTLLGRLSDDMNKQSLSGSKELEDVRKRTTHSWECVGAGGKNHNHNSSDIPDEVYEVFGKAIFEALAQSDIEKLEIKDNKWFGQTIHAIVGGMVSGTEQVRVTKDRKTVKYTVEYYVSAIEGADFSHATVTWYSDGAGHKAILATNLSDKAAKQAMMNYCAALAELNKEAWKQFLACYADDVFGLIGIPLKPGKSKEYLDKAEKIIKALCDKKEADKLLEETAQELGNETLEYLEKTYWAPWTNRFTSFITDNVPGATEIVKAAKTYQKVAEKFHQWENEVNKLQELQNASDLKKAEELFNAFASSFDQLEKELDALP